jgi:galactosyl transferase GMA12/MNN10 family
MNTRARTGGVVVTAAGPTMRAALHDLALPTFRQWAARWGWEVVAHDLAADGVAADDAAQRAKWAKLRLLRAALRQHPMALWIDADVLLVRTDEDISIHLHPDHFQALALEQVPSEHRVNPNTGVWLLRSCPESTAFLDAVEQAGPQPGPWADQGAVLAALGWDRGDQRYHWARPGRGSPFLARTSWLPTGWNQPWVDGRAAEDCFNSDADSYADRPTVPAPHALHFMGMAPDARYRAMASVVGSARPELAAAADPSSPVSKGRVSP